MLLSLQKYMDDETFLGDFSGERRYLPVKVNLDKIQLPVFYDTEKFPCLETISKEDHKTMVDKDYKGVIAQAVQIYRDKTHDFTLTKELRSDLAFVIQTYKNENRYVQNFLDFMEWTETFSDTKDILCSAEFTSRYPETNEIIFAELMENEMRDIWTLAPSIKSRKIKIDNVIRVSKKFYHRRLDTNEINYEHLPF